MTTNHSPQSRLLQQLPRSPDIGNLPCLAERLGRLFGLGDTMTLDAAIAWRSRCPGSPQPAVIERLTEELATSRRALIRRIEDWAGDVTFDDEPTFEPLQNAWLGVQRKVAATSRQLRDKVRKAMKDQNPALAHLAELDSVFDHAMASYTSQCFATVPKELEQRFQTLKDADSPTPDNNDWLHRYCQEAQNLLLAELDVRLEPILGLLEACHNEVSEYS